MSTYLVTNTGDNGGVNPMPGAGTGTLRQAIVDADAANTGTVANPDLIQFAIPTSDSGYNPTTGAFTIQPLSALPGITDTLVLDGCSQAGASPNTLAQGDNAVLKIDLDGSMAGTSAVGLEINAPQSVVRGLDVTNWSGYAIWLRINSSNSTVAGNFLGTDVTGEVAMANGSGPLVLGNTPNAAIVVNSANNLIGGTDPASRNLVSGNAADGIVIEDSSQTNNVAGNQVEGNFIGTDATGRQALGNMSDDVYITYCGANTVGGTSPGGRNIISGSTSGDGVQVGTATGTVIEGNYIGLDVTGTKALGNAGGVAGTDDSNTTVGGMAAGAGNVISGNGFQVSSVNSAGFVVQGNFIGTDASGEYIKDSAGNPLEGAFTIGIATESDGTLIGGTTGTIAPLGTAGFAGNLVSGFSSGIGIALFSSGNTVQGNLIGTDWTGEVGLGNNDGISLRGNGNTIGGTTSEARNIISGNAHGISGDSGNPSNNVIEGNYFGTDPSGAAMPGLGNGNAILLGDANDCENNVIGGSTQAAGNLIANSRFDGIDLFGLTSPPEPGAHDTTISNNTIVNNGDDGVNVSGNADGYSILGNSIYGNGGLGIDVTNDAITHDAQAAPVLEAATSKAGNTYVGGVLSSTPSTTFRIEFFANTSPDPSGYGEGEQYLGFLNVTTDAAGNADFLATLTGVDTSRPYLSATATRLDSVTQVPIETSAFSNNVNALASPAAYVVTTTADSGPGSLRDAINQINADTNHALYVSPTNPNVDEIDFSITAASDAAGGGTGYNATTDVATIKPQSALPQITNAVLIDGYTQAGSSQNTLLGPSALGSTDSTLHPEKYGDDAVLKVELDGESAGTATGLNLAADNVTVQGLAINRFASDGIIVAGNGDVIQGNFLGTDITGKQALGNLGADVYVQYANDTIGGTTPAARNIISGALPDASGSVPSGEGIFLFGDNAVVQGNFIGTDVTGTKPLGNVGWGVHSDSNQSLIGGSIAGAGNLISGNGDGLLIQASENVIEGNFIGTDVTGTKKVANGSNGIFFQYGGSNTIGAPAAGNLISGNMQGGIRGTGDNNVIQSNFIGTDVTGTKALGNDVGIDFQDGGNNNTIGGLDTNTPGTPLAGGGNLISGNHAGVTLGGRAGLPFSGNVIEGNYIGTDVTGTTSISGGGVGLGNAATYNTIGGTTAAARNIISGQNGEWDADISIGDGSGGTGVDLPSNNLVEGNYIGTDATGTVVLGNGNGVSLFGAINNTIGGTGSGAGNLIMGGQYVGEVSGHGIFFWSNGNPNDPNNGNLVQGNTIEGNGEGVDVLDGSGNTIGGTASGAGNVISGNGGDGIDLSSGGNFAEGNNILTNIGNGVAVYSSNDTVGGTATGAGNDISGNGGDGVFVGNGATGVSVLGNSISASGGLGIHLDSTTNANNNQAAPVLTSASSSSSGTTISGTLTSVANTTFRVEFFANQSPNPSGYGEGLTLLGSAKVTTDANGYLASSPDGSAVITNPDTANATFTVSGLKTVPTAQGYLTSTATVAHSDGTFGDTSQFSRDIDYQFNGFLPPLSNGLTFAVNRAIPIKFTLSDFNGHAITSLSAVSALQIFNSQGVDILGGSGVAGLSVSGGTYSYLWQTKSLPAGSYTISVTLADGTTHTKTIQLTASGSSAGLVTDGSGGTATAGALLGGEVDLYVDNSNGDLTSDELARIQDAVTSIDATIAPYGVVINEVSDSTQANVTLNMDTTSGLGGTAQGVLGCTTNADQVTMILGWNWYAGSDATQIGSGQYDFETAVMHELGHVLGLGHSSDSTSVMYASLATGTANRVLTAADLNVPDSDSGPCALHVAATAPVSGPTRTGPTGTIIPSGGSLMSGMDQLFAEDTGLLLNAWNAYQSEWSALSALWQQADALAVQQMDGLLSLQAGAMGISKEMLTRDLLFAGSV